MRVFGRLHLTLTTTDLVPHSQKNPRHTRRRMEDRDYYTKQP